MKRFILALTVAMLVAIGSAAYAGRVVCFHPQGSSGTTLYKSDSGVSVVAVIDQKQFPASFDGIYTLGFPSTITYATTTADPGGTGNTATSGTTITYYYITMNALTQPTDAQVEALEV